MSCGGWSDVRCAEELAYHDISAKAATFSVISQYKSLLMYRSKRLKCYLKYGSMVGSELHYLVSVFCLQIFLYSPHYM